MSRLVRSALLVAFALPVTACSPPPPAAPVENAPADVEAINKIRESFAAAYSAGDAEAIGDFYVADGVSKPNNGPTLNGRDAIVASMKNMFDQVAVKLTLIPDQTKTIGTTGFDSGHFTVEITPKAGGPTTTSEGRYLVIVAKQTDGSWKVVQDMDNAGPPPAAAEGAPASSSTAK